MKNYTINYYKDKSQNNYEEYVLGCDIGGTNTNIAIAGIHNNKPILLFSLDFKTKNLNSIIPAINETIKFANNNKIKVYSACIGAAGPILESYENIKLTNIEWDLNKNEIINSTKLYDVQILNDFQLIGYGINLLNHNSPNDISIIRKDKNIQKSKQSKVIIGAGTGFGKTILNFDENKNIFVPYPSEGGHTDIPIHTDKEMELISYIKTKKNIGDPIIYEDVLSGRGWENIYNFFRYKKLYEKSIYTNEIDKITDKAPLISKYRSKDKICNEVFNIFTTFYARCAKNFVLDTYSLGGLYIAGGISIKNDDIFFSNRFLNEFEKNSKKYEILHDIPIFLIKDYTISIKGACFAAMLNNKNITKST